MGHHGGRVSRKKMLAFASIAGLIWVIPALTLLTFGSGYLVAIVIGPGLIQGTFAGSIGAVWPGVLALGLAALVVAARTGGDDAASGTSKGEVEMPDGERSASSASAA